MCHIYIYNISIPYINQEEEELSGDDLFQIKYALPVNHLKAKKQKEIEKKIVAKLKNKNNLTTKQTNPIYWQAKTCVKDGFLFPWEL